MVTPRLRSLDPPHKGLRNALSQLCLQAGKTHYGKAEEVAFLQELGKEVFHLLEDHTHTEDNFILAPLEIKMPGATAHETDDHERITQQEQELKNKLLSFNGTQSEQEGHEFYLSLTEFHSRYLEHIAYEDRVTEPQMQAQFTDEELIGHQVVIMQHMDFKTLLLWFKYIVPARRMEENSQVLTAFKANAPATAFEAVAQQIREVLPAAEFEALMHTLQ
jgi:hypothetical protein